MSAAPHAPPPEAVPPGLTALVHRPAEGPPALLFLLFHGHGQDEEAMQPLLRALAAEYPQAAVLSLRAPHPVDAAPGEAAPRGWQFFSRRELDDENRELRVRAQLPGFIDTVRRLQQHFGVPWTHTALAGFSQGGIVALDAVQQEPRLAGRVLAFGARHVLPLTHAPEDTTVHLFHGMQDTVIPYQLPVMSARALIGFGGDVTADILPDLRHELHPQLIDKALYQLRHFLPQRLWREALADAPQDRPAPGSAGG
ncbi:esterase [Piscinibacter sakaiensis]|uniref:Phospholipase/carboxylesterase family protein n=2 Tax=Piscinibacter sakaiensis TaxID=1547922 RepID=A0A0K8NYH6_PISS1|nr:esterase [Piscinibacter sakaiensis]GAP35436.1 phospholipase/carboxylesterase family protein [Piscinibacter sakaiensis]